MQAKDRVLAAVFGGLVIALVVIGSIVGIGQAAPPAAPTPVSGYNTAAGASLNVTFQGATALTADTNTSGSQLPAYGWLDIQSTIDQTVIGVVPNTTTITIQFSNDNSNWVSGPVIVNANTADASDLTRVPLFGRYVRFNQDVANTNPITITLIGLAK